MCIVRVRRHHLVEDALDEIARQYRRDLFKPLRVHFIGEDGIDAGGAPACLAVRLLPAACCLLPAACCIPPAVHTHTHPLQVA
jgi:hypothetical protein